MPPQRSGLGRPIGTQGAEKGLLAGMNAQMILEARGIQHIYVAVGTHVATLAKGESFVAGR